MVRKMALFLSIAWELDCRDAIYRVSNSHPFADGNANMTDAINPDAINPDATNPDAINRVSTLKRCLGMR